MNANTADLAAAGDAMHAFMTELYPICRSITGDGVRETLRLIGLHIPIEVREVPSGTQVFDWVVPKEWNIRDAYIKDRNGTRVVDFRKSNLHVLNYSVPVHRTMLLADLRPHLFTLPNDPDLVPYKTSYYEERWGFCLSQRTLDGLGDGEYEVSIDASLEPGHLTYGEFLVPGSSDEEILISCHVCHPSLCNDNLSGIALSTFLALHVAAQPRRYSYRFLFLPATIGAITWLSQNEASATQIKHGLVVANVGDAGAMRYKRSRQGNAPIDRAVAHVLMHAGQPFEIADFSPEGYDERQYCSPGFNLAVGSLTRTPYGRYREYHTSADDLSFVKPACMEHSLRTYIDVLDVLERDGCYVNQNPKCEPQLGKRGLYGTLGGNTERREVERAMLWVLNFSTGGESLLDIAERSGVAFQAIHTAALRLCESGLLHAVAVTT